MPTPDFIAPNRLRTVGSWTILAAAALCVAPIADAQVITEGAAKARLEVEATVRMSWDEIRALPPQEWAELPRAIEHAEPPPPRPWGEEVDAAEAAAAPALGAAAPAEGACSGLTDATLDDSFAGLGDNNTGIPPDVHGAAGPNHLMLMFNTQVRIQQKDGTVVSTVGLNTFWQPLGGNPFDPRIMYDSTIDRWIATALTAPFSANSAVFFAISDTSDPTGMWSFFSFVADSGATGDTAGDEFADFPDIGFNDTWIAITVNMFTNANGAFNGAKMWVIDKSTLPPATTLGVTEFPRCFDCVQIGMSTAFGLALRVASSPAGESPGTLYLVDSSGFFLTGDNRAILRLSRITGTGASPTWSVVPGSGIATGSGFFSVANNFSWTQINASQPGTSFRISTNDGRMLDALYRNGSVWCAHSGGFPVAAPPSGPADNVNRTNAYWYQLDPSSTAAPILQSDSIDGGVDVHHYFPSVAANCANDMCLGFTRSSPTLFAQAAAAGRLAADAPGTTRPIQVIKPGEDSYVKRFSGSEVRWGDYSSTVIDPADDTSFWTVQQYAETDVGPLQTNDRWGSWWGFKTAIDCLGDLNGDGTVDGADLGLLLQAWDPLGQNPPSSADLNGDGMVDGADLGLLLQDWGCGGP